MHRTDRGTHFRLIDTAGVDGERLDHLFRQKPNVDSTLLHDMMKQTAQAAFQSDLVLLMFDARVGVTSDLMETARWLRKYRLLNREEAHKKPVLMLANKVEGDAWNYEGSPVLESIVEAERIGFGTVVPISAYHGEGMADIAVAIEQAHARMQEQIIQASKKEPGQAIAKGKAEKPLQLAILGRQNVGKSTLVNALLKEDRVLVGARPGLTRDAIAVEWTWKGRPVQLVDTAGIRKRSRRDHSSTIEDMAVQDALRAMKVADVCVLVIDGGARMLQRQELTIIEAILKEGRSLVVAANKMDLVVEAGTDEDDGYSREDFTKAVREQLEARFPAIRKTPIVAMSSLTGEAVEELMPVVFTARDRWSRTISTGQLNRWLREVLHTHPAPFVGNVRVRIKYIIQTKGRPPTFLLFSNTDTIPESYLRYLTRNFQDTFEMFGMDVRLVTKKASLNPYEPTKKRGGMGLGGREARKKRVISNLKTLGVPKVERHRKRRSTRRSYIMR